MPAIVACIPDWYIASYLRDEGGPSLLATLLAVTQFIVRAIMLPVDLTLEVIHKERTMVLELVVIATEGLFVPWIWHGSNTPGHDIMMRMWSPLAWTCIVSAMFITHLASICSRDRDFRAASLVLDVGWYGVVLYALLRHGGIYLGEVFIGPLAIGAVVAVLSLRQPGSEGLRRGI